MAAEGFVEEHAKPPQHTAEYLATTYKCAARREHIARVARGNWPPRFGANPNTGERNHLAAVCERCGVNLIVYNPPTPDMTVVLYGDAGEAHGRIEDEQGTVVEELPPTGGVIDEPEPKGRRR